MKGNIGLLFKQKVTIPAGQSYESYLSAPFSENNGSWVSVQPMKFYNSVLNNWVFTNEYINGTNVTMTTGVLSVNTYVEHSQWFANPLKIKSLGAPYGRRKYFDSENWEIVKRFKNFEWWNNTNSYFSFTDINFGIFPKMILCYCNDTQAPVGAKFNYSTNYLLQYLIIGNARDAILPDFQMLNDIKEFTSTRTLAFTTSPMPALNFSNRLFLTKLVLTNSTQYPSLNITGATSLMTLQVLGMQNLTNLTLLGFASCINLQDVRIGNHVSVQLGTLDISTMFNLTRLEVYTAGITSMTLPATLPATLAYIDVSNNNFTNGWVNNLKTSRTTITFNAYADSSKRGSTVLDFNNIFINNQVNSVINLGTWVTPSNYNITQFNKIINDLNNKWTSGGSVTCYDMQNYLTNLDTFSGGINGILAWKNLRVKGCDTTNIYNPTSKKVTVTTTIPNELVNISTSLPTGVYQNSIDWGDGSNNTYTSTSSIAKNHTYVTVGTYIIEVFYSDISVYPTQTTQLDVMCRAFIQANQTISSSTITKLNFIDNYNATESVNHTCGAFTCSGNTSLVNVTFTANYKMAMNTNNIFDFRNCALNTLAIENILKVIDVNAGSVTLRFIKLENGTNASKATWTTNANTYYTSLTAKGYTITYNP